MFYTHLQKNLDAMPIHGNGSTEIRNADGKIEVMGRLRYGEVEPLSFRALELDYVNDYAPSV
jgi:hypothetical protein